MKRLALALSLLVLLAAGPAFALDLHSARSAGQVGEQTDGYIAAIQSTPDVAALVTDVNAKRQTEYARISKEKGQPVDVVAKLAAAEIIGKLSAGSMYQGADGSWKKK